MKLAKQIITGLLVVIALAACLVALNWRSLLSAEQKLQYGLVFDATEDYRKAAAEEPQNEQALYNYIEVLVRKGNLGRACYLSNLYGIENKGLEQLRGVIEQSLKDKESGEAHSMSDDPAVKPYEDDPVRQALRYLEGYQHALLGDWASAKIYFSAIDEKHLAPELRPYAKYYLARSYRLAGDDNEKALVESLLADLVESKDPVLAPKAAYNLVSWYLGQGDAESKWAEKYTSTTGGLGTESVWARQKIAEEIGRYSLSQGSPERAWSEACKALSLGTGDASGKAVCQLAVDALNSLSAQGSLETLAMAGYRPGSLLELVKGAGRLGLAEELKPLMAELASGAGSMGSGQSKAGEFSDEVELAYVVLLCELGDSSTAVHRSDTARYSNLPPQKRAFGYFHIAQALETDKKWNDAMAYYRRVVDLGGEYTPEAHYQRYAIIKAVQDKLDLAGACDALLQIVEHQRDSGIYAKAVEELIPLQIFRGDRKEALDIITEILQEGGRSDSTMLSEVEEVSTYWKAYLSDTSGGKAVGDALRDKITTKYWNYYELTSNYPPVVEQGQSPPLVSEEENAGEYLAGLGLSSSAHEYYEAQGALDSQLLIYLNLTNAEITKPVSTLQWTATGILESGDVEDQFLLDYVLSLAYPQPYEKEVKAAARKSNVPEALIYAVMKKESSFKPDAVSWAGAQGLMQLMPSTASWLNNRYSLGLNLSDLTDPKVNIQLGAAYLRSLYDDLGEGNTRSVIHAYNGGPGNFKRWRGQYNTDMVLFTDLVPNEENETFAKKVIKYFKIYDWLISSE